MKIFDLLKKTLDNPVVFNSFEFLMGVNKTRRILVNDYIKPWENCKILDIGCGTGDFRGFLPDNVQYIGIDNNFEYINYAKNKKFKNSNFICTDSNQIKKIEYLKNIKFDIVLSIGVIHHLNDKLFNDLIEQSFDLLDNDGFFFTYDPVLKKNQNKISKFLIDNDRGNYVRNEEGYISKIKKLFPEIKSSQVNNLQNLPYDVLIIKAFKK